MSVLVNPLRLVPRHLPLLRGGLRDVEGDVLGAPLKKTCDQSSVDGKRDKCERLPLVGGAVIFVRK